MRTESSSSSPMMAVACRAACAILLGGSGPVVGALHLAAACLGTFRAASFAQAVLHRWIGHGGLIGSIRRSHIRSHHSIFKGQNFEADAYTGDERSVSHTFVPVAVAIGLLSCWLLPLHLALASLHGWRWKAR